MELHSLCITFVLIASDFNQYYVNVEFMNTEIKLSVRRDIKKNQNMIQVITSRIMMIQIHINYIYNLKITLLYSDKG